MCRARCAAAAARPAWPSSPVTATSAASSCGPTAAWSGRRRSSRPSTRAAAAAPTVVIVSACHSGVFLTPAMRQPNRVVLAAAARDRASFGCGAGDQYTYYDQCLLQQFDGAATWRDLAAATRSCVESLERRMGVSPPSQPQIFVGAAVTDLGSVPFRSSGGAHAAGGGVTTSSLKDLRGSGFRPLLPGGGSPISRRSPP